MDGFWRKRIIWGGFFVILIAIPLTFYFFKSPLLSLLPVNSINKIQSTQFAKPGTCLILEEQYCFKAKLITQQTPLGKTAKMIGLRVDTDKPLTMPIDGQVAKTKLNNDVIFYKGYRAYVFDPNNPKRKYIITGDIRFDDMFSRNMKQGEIFGYIQNTGIEMLGYNVMFYVADIVDGREVENIEEMRRLFPSIKP